MTIVRMKRLLSIVLLLAVLILPLSACKKDKESSNTDKTTVSTAPIIPKEDPEVDTTDYRAEVTKRFENLSATDVSAFTFASGVTGLTVTGYQGNDEHVRVPDSIDGLLVVGIADGVFQDQKQLKTLYVPDSVSSLGKDMLKGCDALEALRIPILSQTESGEQFLGCLFGGVRKEDNILVPASLSYVCVEGCVRAITEAAFADCNKIQAVVLGDGVTVIEDFAFSFCENLKYVNFEGLTEIGAYAFSNCNDLVSVTFGVNLEQIGLGAFQGCSSISSMTLPFVGGSSAENTYLGYIFGAEHPDFTAGYIPAYLRDITILDGCDSLGNYAFFECSVVRTVVVPKSVRSIGVRAFEGCTVLKTLDLSSVCDIRENAFFGCTALESVTLGESLQSLGINVFYGCTALKSIVLPNSLKKLPASAFADCTSLESIDFGGVTNVGRNAVRNCTALDVVKILDGATLEEGNAIIKELAE